MSVPTGWHRGADGSSRYWDGRHWLDWDGAQWLLWDGRRWVPTAPMTPYGWGATVQPTRTGRSHRVAAAMMLIGALLIAGAALLPWITVTGPTLGVRLADWVDVAVDPSTELASADLERKLLLACAGLTGVFAMGLMFDRGRVSGVFLRLLGLASAVPPGLLALWLWAVVTSENPTADLLTDDPGAMGELLRLGDRFLTAAGVYSVSAAEGLLALSVGLVLVGVGCLVPSSRR